MKPDFAVFITAVEPHSRIDIWRAPAVTGVVSSRRFSAPALAHVRQPGGLALAAAHPIFVPESSFWEPAASAELQDIWQRWGTNRPPPPPPAKGSVRTPSFATRSAREPQPAEQAGSPAAERASPSSSLETRPSFEDVAQFAYEDEGRQPSAIVRPKTEAQQAAAAAGAAAAQAAASITSSRAASPAAPPSDASRAGSPALQQAQPVQQQQPPQPAQQQPSQLEGQPQPTPPDAAVQLPAVSAVQRGEGMAEAADVVPAIGSPGRQIVRSVSRGSISRPNLGRPSLGRSDCCEHALWLAMRNRWSDPVSLRLKP
jgi:hypothetical protein